MPNPPIRRKKFDIYEFSAGCLNQSLISQSVGFKCQIIYAKKMQYCFRHPRKQSVPTTKLKGSVNVKISHLIIKS